MRKRRWVALPSLCLVVVSACGGSDGDPKADGPAAPSTTTTAAEPAAEQLAVDWEARTVTPATVGPWTIRFCEGEAPLICLHRDGEVAGAIEVNTFPRDSFADPDLADIAAASVRTFQADRKEGCGTDYLVRADPVAPATVLGDPDGLRYGWTATKEGRVVERTRTYAATKDDTIVLLVAGALDADGGGCIPRMHEFTVEGLAAAEPTLDRLASANFDPRTTASGG